MLQIMNAYVCLAQRKETFTKQLMCVTGMPIKRKAQHAHNSGDL